MCPIASVLGQFYVWASHYANLLIITAVMCVTSGSLFWIKSRTWSTNIATDLWGLVDIIHVDSSNLEIADYSNLLWHNVVWWLYTCDFEYRNIEEVNLMPHVIQNFSLAFRCHNLFRQSSILFENCSNLWHSNQAAHWMLSFFRLQVSDEADANFFDCKYLPIWTRILSHQNDESCDANCEMPHFMKAYRVAVKPVICTWKCNRMYSNFEKISFSSLLNGEFFILQ